MEPSLDLSELKYTPNKHALTDSLAVAMLSTDPVSSLCDVVLVSSDGISVPACKALLAHRSKFFHSLFFSPFEGATPTLSNLPITSAAMRNVLWYVYSNETPPIRAILSRLSVMRSNASARPTASEYQSLVSDLDDLISLAIAANYVRIPHLVHLCVGSITALFDNVPDTGCAVLCKCHEHAGYVLHEMDITRLRRVVLENLPLFFDVPYDVLLGDVLNDAVQPGNKDVETNGDMSGATGGTTDHIVHDNVVNARESPDPHTWRVLEMCAGSLGALLELELPKTRDFAQTLLIGLHAWAKDRSCEEPGRWKVVEELANNVDLNLCHHTFLLGPASRCGILRADKVNIAIRYHLSLSLKALQAREEELSEAQAALEKKNEELFGSVARECETTNALKMVEKNVEFGSSVLSNLERFVTDSIKTVCEEKTRNIKPVYTSGKSRINPTWMLESLIGIEKNLTTAQERHGLTKLTFRSSLRNRK